MAANYERLLIGDSIGRSIAGYLALALLAGILYLTFCGIYNVYLVSIATATHSNHTVATTLR